MEDHSKHFAGGIAQKAIIEKDGKILVCRGIGDRVWGFPGGRLHKEEKPHEGLIREVKEEFGIEVKIISPIAVIRSYHRKFNMWNIFVAYTCRIVGSDFLTVDSKEIEESKWIPKADLATIPMFDDCREVTDIFLTHSDPLTK